MASSKNKGPRQTTKIRGSVDTTPPEFLAKRGRKIEKQPVPLDVEPDEPTGDLIESRTVQDENTNERVKINTTLTGDETDTLPAEVMLEDGQKGTLVRSLVDEGTGLNVTALTARAEQRNLGNGQLDQTVVTRPSNLALPEYTKEIPDAAVPEEFRVLVPVETSETTSAGTAAAPTLGTGELLRRERQLDKWLKRVLVRFRSLTSLPVSLSGKRMFQGLEAAVVRTLAVGNQTISPDFKTVDGEVRATGAGTSVKEKVTVDAFPNQPGQLYDEVLGVITPYTQKTLALGASIGDNNTEISPLDYVKARVRVFDLTAIQEILDDFHLSYPGTAALQLPDVLVSIEALEVYSHGAGEYNEAATGVGSGTTYFLSMNTQGSGQGSAGTMIELAIETKQYWRPNVDTTVHLFFMPTDTTKSDILAKLSSLVGSSVSAWPKFDPQGHTLIVAGEKKSAEVRVKTGFQESSSSDGSSNSDTGGKGKSFDVSPSIHAVRLPPMIHNTITITGATDNTHNLDVTASASDPINGTLDDFIADEVHSKVLPDSLPATVPAAIPTSGIHLLRCNVDIYRHGRVKVYAEVVNMATEI